MDSKNEKSALEYFYLYGDTSELGKKMTCDQFYEKIIQKGEAIKRMKEKNIVEFPKKK